jgi:hypothetical protein
MKWVTWENVGVDRMGCAWLIRRFIDPGAVFVFVPVGHDPLPRSATPFDLPGPGVKLTHRGGHCSFHAFLREYNLTDPVLKRIARIIDEADTVQDALIEPAAAGLDMLCRGIRRASANDTTALKRGAMLYDALYAELTAEMASPTASQGSDSPKPSKRGQSPRATKSRRRDER